jgi:anti-anti-sigma regulatory factor
VTDTDPDQPRVLFDGALTVRTVASARTSLLEALADHPALLVDCGAADTVDLTFIQLLLAARLSAHLAGKRLALAAPPRGALLAALGQGGFLPPSGADPFWSDSP